MLSHAEKTELETKGEIVVSVSMKIIRKSFKRGSSTRYSRVLTDNCFATTTHLSLSGFREQIVEKYAVTVFNNTKDPSNIWWRDLLLPGSPKDVNEVLLINDFNTTNLDNFWRIVDLAQRIARCQLPAFWTDDYYWDPVSNGKVTLEEYAKTCGVEVDKDSIKKTFRNFVIALGGTFPSNISVE